MYRETLSRGKIFLQCDCSVSDTGQDEGCLSVLVDAVSLGTGSTNELQWWIPVWYRFDYCIVDFNGEDFFKRRGKYSLHMGSRFLFSVVESKTNSAYTPARKQDEMENAVYDMFHSMLRNRNEDGCSIAFASGTRFGDVSPVHPTILPALASAYANLKLKTEMQAAEIVKDVSEEHKRHAIEALYVLKRRYSAFVAQTQKKQLLRDFGVSK